MHEYLGNNNRINHYMGLSHAEKFIKNAQTIHPIGLYDYSLVIDSYINAHTKVPIICNNHGGIFYQKPVVHYNHKSGCNICNGGIALDTAGFIRAAILKHGDHYDYSNVNYIDTDTHVNIGCPICHNVFSQTPKKHLKGSNCNICHTGTAISSSEFISRAVRIWGDKNDYSLVEYVSSNTPVTIICMLDEEHGQYQKTPNNHTRSSEPQGCPKCAAIALANFRRNNREDMLAKLVPNQSGDIDYRLFHYNGYLQPITLICTVDGHGEFSKTYWNALQGQGCPICAKKNYYNTSPAEETFLNDVAQNCSGSNMVRNTYDIIKPFELDGYFPDQHIGIEYCGLYWHSELQGKSRNYHRDKMKLCTDLGIKLITVFEDEYLNKPLIVMNRIKHIVGHNAISIYARKCNIAEIDLPTARDFLNTYHLQGYTGCSYRYGLYYDGVVVAVMTFSKPNLAKGQVNTKDGVYEISRFATSMRVVGGGSRLVKAFERARLPNELYTYADLRWGSGDSYLKMGFTLCYDTPPNYWYFKSSTKRIHRFALRKNISDDQSITEWENRKLQGWNRIWDCGHRKFTKTYLGNP